MMKLTLFVAVCILVVVGCTANVPKLDQSAVEASSKNMASEAMDMMAKMAKVMTAMAKAMVEIGTSEDFKIVMDDMAKGMVECAMLFMKMAQKYMGGNMLSNFSNWLPKM